MSTTVEKIKSRLSIVDVVGSYIKLEKAGSNFKARCPFHNEKTPSFFVSPSRDTYHCFGCNKGGDIFSFTEDIEGVQFIDALNMLASRAGVIVLKENPKERGEKEKIHSLLEEATLFYRRELVKYRDVVKYLRERGLTTASIKSFNIGYAPKGWRNLVEFLTRKGYSKDIMLKSGMVIRGVKKSNGEEIFYDRFRGRIIFPLWDLMGKHAGFSGRLFNGDDKEGKYINTPQTLLYDKSKILYPYHKAKDSIRKKDKCVFVEGQMDVILSHQSGIDNTLAVSGTAITSKHLKLIKRMTDNLIFSFDADEAGENALLRSGKMALNEGFNVGVIPIPGGKDPADIILEGRDRWTELVDRPQHIILYFVGIINNKKDSTDREKKLAISKIVIQLLISIENKIDQSHFVSLVSRKMDIPEKALYEEIEKAEYNESDRSGYHNEKEEVFSNKTRKELILDKIIGLMFLQKSNKKNTAELEADVKNILGSTFLNDRALSLTKEERSKLEFEAELWYKDSKDLIGATDDLINNLKEEVLKERLTAVLKKLKNSEEENDEKNMRKHLKECQEITKELTELKNI